jgi:hypothetical protein
MKTNWEMSMRRTRTGGAGRKPQGEFRGKSATFTTRITPELRKALEREAKKNSRSLSQEVERRLVDSIQRPKILERALGAPQNRALGIVVARLAESVESTTGERWRQNPFAFQSLQFAITLVLDRLAPAGPVQVPPQIEKLAAGLDRIAPEQGAHHRRPAGVGSAIALGLLDQIRISKSPPLAHEPHTHYADGFYFLPGVRRDLGLD